ncbi:MAG TPA: PKD domain-containing protein [Pyrinomonadaceae bacterium]|jgi:PKD repeat protein
MRLILFAALCISAALFFSTLKGSAASPSSGTLTPTSGTLSYSAGPFLVPNVTSNIPGNTQPQCNNLTPCDDYNLTVDLSTASQEFLDKHRIEVTISWPLAQADFDLYVLKGAAVVKDAATSADPEIAVFDPEPGTNTYKVRVAPFAPAGQSFTATIRFVEKSTTTTPPPPGGGEAPRFHTFLTPTGVGDDFGEPSIGANWLSGNIMFYGGFSADALRVRFDDSSSPAKVNWTQTPLNLAATARALGDPILYTDRQTGRTLVSQLEGGTKQSTTDYTEDDGATYKPTLGSGINSGVDHQTLGGGPFAAGAPPHTYPNAVYYCAQDVADANCALSIDGGITFGPAVPIYTADQCDGIHGHIKVAPDGTAYVPNAECGGLNSPVTLGSNQAVVVSENNGITWEVRHVPGTTASGEDPSIGIASDGTLYFGFVDGDGHPKATVSRDKGLTWTTPIDIGTAFDIRHAVFPVTVAGDPNRAAIGFIGTPAVGDPNDAATFKGVWHLYIATTYNGGQSWATVDATPDDPVQVGSVCRAGTLCGNDRNLLDFNDATVDKEGRILIGYADGCVAPACTAATAAEPPPYDTSRSAKGVITRQSGGKRMFAQYDPDPADPSAPAAPRVDNVTRSATGAGILIDWSEPDNGGSPISAYNVYRKSGADGAYSLLASVAPDKTAYTDAGGSEAESIYKVTATNSIGEGTSSGEFGVQMPTESACIAPGLTVVTDPAGDQTGTAQSDVRSVSVSEIYDPANSANKLYFTIKMADLSVVPPQARFTVFFKRGATEWYISMQSDVNTAAPGTPLYRYGHITVNPTTGTRTQNDDGRLDFGSYSPDGTIVMAISNPTKGTAADDLAFPPLVAGESITDVNAFTQQTVGVLLLATDTTGKGSYKLVGNASCQPNTAPVAALSATPQTGFAPHAVNFTGAGSTDADAGDSIATYRFDFGDGSPIVTQSSPTISHTYANAGEYAARLTVTDSRGKSSINVARSIINVAPPCNDNVALASSGAVASASSTLSPTKSYPASSAIDGSNTGLNWGKGGGWSDKTRDAYPDWLQVDFNGGKRINEVRVYSLQDDFRQPRVPTADMTSTLYGLIDFDVQYFDAATNSWATVPNGAVRGNNKVVSIIRGLNITTSRIRVLVLNARDQHSRIVEVEAYGCNAQ